MAAADNTGGESILLESADTVAETASSAPSAGKTHWQGVGVVAGALLANFISVGVVNTFGVVLRAEETDPSSAFRNVGSFKLGFVTGTAAGFTFLVGPFSNVLVSRLGVRFPVGLGVVLMTIALELGSLATQFWQLLLSQGILWGIGSSLCFIPAIGLPSQWFDKRRGIATGIASAGAPVGAMVLSPAIQAIISGASLPWALRALGFIILGLGILTTVLVRPKTTSYSKTTDGPAIKTAPTQYKFLDLTVLKARGYSLYMFVAFLQMFGYTTPVFFLPNYARAIGLTARQGSNIIVILNAGNFLGRVAAGQLGDMLGVLNVLSICLFLAGLLCVVHWLFAHTFAVLAAFAFLWGIFAGGYWSLTVPAAARIVGPVKLGSAVAINFLMNVVPPIFAAPIGAQLNDGTASLLGVDLNSAPAYRYLIVWSGLAYMVSGLLLVVVRFMLQPKPWAPI